MTNEEITAALFEQCDPEYRQFQKKLIPTVDPDSVIGVRTPALRSFAGLLARREDISAFLGALPHRYFDENQLHAFIISEIRDYSRCVEEVERFLPFVDNWATCDQMSPKAFRKHREELRERIGRWIRSDHTYTVRFGIGMLMEHFLDGDFRPEYPRLVAGIRSEEYYVNMMIAWYFATALAKQYEAVLPYIEERCLDDWTHNKAIRKAVESRRVPDERKAYLKTLRSGKEKAPQ